MKIKHLEDAYVEIRLSTDHLKDAYDRFKQSDDGRDDPITYHEFAYQVCASMFEIIADIGGSFAEIDFSVIMKKTEFCSFCGQHWRTDEDTGAPKCCNKALEEWNMGLRKERQR